MSESIESRGRTKRVAEIIFESFYKGRVWFEKKTICLTFHLVVFPIWWLLFSGEVIAKSELKLGAAYL